VLRTGPQAGYKTSRENISDFKFGIPQSAIRNSVGAGKTTLLKILSRIVRLRLTNVTEPTEGYAETSS